MLNSKEKDGITYFEIFVRCPVCHERSVKGNETFAIHKDCGGKMYAGDNGHYLCELCNDESFAKNWEIECRCSQIESILFKRTEEFRTNHVHITMMGLMVCSTGVRWLQRFLENMNGEES